MIHVTEVIAHDSVFLYKCILLHSKTFGLTIRKSNESQSINQPVYDKSNDSKLDFGEEIDINNDDQRRFNEQFLNS